MIISLCGKRYSGKSTIANILVDLSPTPIFKVSLADSLRELYAKFENVPIADLINPATKEKHRRGLQLLSEAEKLKYGEDVFVKRLLARLQPGVDYILDDERFFIEDMALPKAITRTYLIRANLNTRIARGFTPNHIIDTHRSEMEISEQPEAFFIQRKGQAFDNNFLNKEDLIEEVKKWFHDIL